LEWATAEADGGSVVKVSSVKVSSWLGLVVATAALAVLAGCTGGSPEALRSAPTPPAQSVPPSVPPSTPSVEPTEGGLTPPVSPVPGPPLTPREPPVRKPVIGEVWTTPKLPCDVACTLTPRAGTVTFHAQVSDATRVQFYLVPTGTGTWDNRKSIGVDRSGEDGWSVRYTYADEPLWSHLLVVAHGPAGTTEKLPFNLHHPDPR
jgi:hypothetical protein